MTITINAPAEVEAAITEKATRAGLSVSEYTLRALMVDFPFSESAFAQEDPALARREAMAAIESGYYVVPGAGSAAFLTERNEEARREEERFLADYGTAKDETKQKRRAGMSSVLDSSAAVAFLTREAGADVVARHLNAGGCIMHAVNVCEVLYHFRRLLPADPLDLLIQRLAAIGLTTRMDLDAPFLQIAAEYKAAPGPTALGDCFGLALAQREGLPFVTSDRHALTRVTERGIVVIDFIR